MTEESDESASSPSDSDASWSIADLHRRLDLDDTPARPDPDDEEPSSLADLAGMIRDRRALSEWRWVTIGSRTPAAEDATEDAAEEDPALQEELGSTSSILLVGPLGGQADDTACRTLLADDTGESANRILVTNDQSMEARLRTCHGGAGVNALGGETVIIGMGEPSRGASATSPSVGVDGVTTVSISDSRNLARLGMHVSRWLTDWEAEPTRLVVCVHSLSTLLQVMDLDTVFRFLHVLNARIDAAGGQIHYHLEPDDHDDVTLSTLGALFDAILTYDEAGTVDVAE